MRTIAWVLSEIKKLRRNKKNILWQQRFLYKLLLHDDIYAIAYNCFSNKSSLKRKEDSVPSNNHLSFIIIERLIGRIRQQDLPDTILSLSRKRLGRKGDKKNQSFDYYINSSCGSIREGPTIVLQIHFLMQLQPLLMETNEWNSFRSIHSVFPFMEDHFSYSYCFLGTKLPYSLHPEVLIRIFRRRIQDAPFLHLLRFILHEQQNLIVSNTPIFFSPRETNRLSIFLWNYYIYESESTLVSLWKKTLHFESFSASPDQANSIQKIEHIAKPSYVAKPPWMITPPENIFFFVKNPSIHYARYENNYMVALKGTKYLAQRWKHFFLRLWQYHFHFWFQPYRIRIQKSSKDCFPFLGYILGIGPKITTVQVEMVDDLPIATSLPTRELCAITPISGLIGLLAKEKFCNTLGHPIGKLAWTTLRDDDILNRFDQIWKNIGYYYSGCSNKEGLYRIQYILRFSCAKTLACRHKSTIRVVWKKHGSKLFPRSSFSEKPELISPFIPKVHYHKKKFWYLDIIQINSLANSLQKRDILESSETDSTNERLVGQFNCRDSR
uniref:Maturase K n=1 Tax=Isoetes virginica TaxID=264948 RepID=A0A3G2BYD3_9TRAC|nr:maturase K [Isoetes virginica]